MNIGKHRPPRRINRCKCLHPGNSPKPSPVI